MRLFKIFIVLLLFTEISFAQEPVQQNKKGSDTLLYNYDNFFNTTGTTKNTASTFDSSVYSLLDLLGDTAFNNLFNVDFNSLFMPDSAAFKNAFNLLVPEINNEFTNIRGALKDSGIISFFYYTKAKDLPGTLTNVIEDFEFFQHVITYTAPIDTGITTTIANARMNDWKKLLKKVFWEKEVKCVEKGINTDQHDIIFTQQKGKEEYSNGKVTYSPGWELILRDITLKGKHDVEILIRKN